MARTRSDELLLGEWACLCLLAERPSHGYDLSTRFAATGDIGRVYTLSRPLTYRAIDQLAARGLVVALREEHGRAGGPRTVYAPTRSGRAAARRWLARPVEHIRDVRTELMLKLVLTELTGSDVAPLVRAQRVAFAPIAKALQSTRRAPLDAVELWREESSRAVLRFLDRLGER